MEDAISRKGFSAALYVALLFWDFTVLKGCVSSEISDRGFSVCEKKKGWSLLQIKFGGAKRGCLVNPGALPKL